MKLIRGQHNLHHAQRGGSVTIGNFDGVHRGHQAMVAQLQARGPAPHTVMTFAPMPSEYFEPRSAPARLSSLREKLADLSKLGVNQAFVLRFDESLAKLSPEDFVQRLLHQGLGARHVLVGDDFRYGARREGDFTRLQADCDQLGIRLDRLDTVEHDDQRISSSRIRDALAHGDTESAAGLLGRAYCISGRVQRGQGKGAGLGFATANVLIRRKPAPQMGVYASCLVDAHGVRHPAVSNLGMRPTIAGSTGCWLETHVLDFDSDLYGQHVTIEFHAFLRPEQRFDGLDALTRQIARDVEQARAVHAAAR